MKSNDLFQIAAEMGLVEAYLKAHRADLWNQINRGGLEDDSDRRRVLGRAVNQALGDAGITAVSLLSAHGYADHGLLSAANHLSGWFDHLLEHAIEVWQEILSDHAKSVKR